MQTKQVRLNEIYGVMKEMLESGGTVNFNPKGTSMLPTIHNDGDRVVIKKAVDPLKKYDLPLYIRDDGQFVLHRVVGVNADGTYNMCGDNQWAVEKGIRHDQLAGIVTEIHRGKRTFSADNKLYCAYVRIWVGIMPLRHILFGGINRVKRTVKRIINKK